MVKVMYNNKLVYNVYIWVLFVIIFGKEKEVLISCNRFWYLYYMKYNSALNEYIISNLFVLK